MGYWYFKLGQTTVLLGWNREMRHGGSPIAIKGCGKSGSPILHKNHIKKKIDNEISRKTKEFIENPRNNFEKVFREAFLL